MSLTTGSPITDAGEPTLPLTTTAQAPTERRPVVVPAPSRPAAPVPALLRSAAIVSLAFVASRLLGLVREGIIAYQFGTSGETSAYNAAFKIPDLLFLVVMAGSFGAAFIPVFAGFLQRGEDDRAWALASTVLNLAAVAILALAALTFALAGPIVRFLVAPGLDPEFQDLTVDLMRVLLLSPILLGLGIAAKGILEAQHRFVLPALAPLVYNAAIILGAVLLGPSIGVMGLGVGVVLGALAHAGIQVPGLVRAGMRWSPRLDLRAAGLAEVARLLLPRVVGLAAFQINFLIVNSFASGQGDAGISAFNFAWQLMMLPHGVLALSVSTVIFPTMARLWADGRVDALGDTFTRAIRPLLFLTVPAAIGLYGFRTAIVQTVLQFGAFDASSTALVAPPLAFFALGLVFYAAVEVLTRAFYAMQDTRTPVIAGVAIVLINVALCALLVGPLGLAGLALSLSLSTAVEALILAVVLWRRLRTGGPGLGFWLFRVGLASVTLGVLVAGMAPTLAEATAFGIAPKPVQLALLAFAIGIAGLGYGLVAAMVGIEELTQVGGPLGRRLGPLLRRLPGAQRLRGVDRPGRR